jgi:hypothetical protein
MILILMAGISGCNKNPTTVTNLPPNVTSNQVTTWANATNYTSQLQTGLHAIVTATIKLNAAGVIKDGPGYTTALNAEGRAEQIIIEDATFLKNVPNTWTLSISARINADMQQVNTQLQLALSTGVLNFKDPTTGQTIAQLVSNGIQIVLLIEQVAAAFQPSTAMNCEDFKYNDSDFTGKNSAVPCIARTEAVYVH